MFSGIVIILSLSVAAAQRCRSQSALTTKDRSIQVIFMLSLYFFPKKRKKRCLFCSSFSEKSSLSFICLKTYLGVGLKEEKEEENIREEVVRERDRDKRGEE